MAKKASLRRVSAAEGEISYELERKSVKNLNLRLRPDGSVHVSAPPAAGLRQIDDFVLKNAGRILRGQREQARREARRPEPLRFVSGERFPHLGGERELLLEAGYADRAEERGSLLLLTLRRPEDAPARERLFRRWERQKAREVFEAVLEREFPFFESRGVARPLLRIRPMRSRWGSCFSGRGIITLNLRLLEAAPACIEFVTLHELCHLLQPDHSPRFYALLGSLMPDWRERKRLLEETVIL